tara:strand:- start:465 stop:6296 length:5832 start_codon:yes stop_codon:yes gene_type:complete
MRFTRNFLAIGLIFGIFQNPLWSTSIQERYNIEAIEELSLNAGDSAASVIFQSTDGVPGACPVQLVITVEAEVEANGGTADYYDEVAIRVGNTVEKLFAGDKDPDGSWSVDPPDSYNGVTKRGSVTVSVTPSDKIELLYLTRNQYWNEGSAEIVDVQVLTAGCAKCGAGSGEASNDCVSLEVYLGGNPTGGGIPGLIRLEREEPSAEIYDPASLVLASELFQYTEVVRALNIGQMPSMVVLNSNGEVWKVGDTLRQIVSPDGFFDIVAISANEYQIRIYDRSSIGPRVGGLFTLAASSVQIGQWTVENPDPQGQPANYFVNITEDYLGSQRVYAFEWIPADENWTLTKGTGDERIKEARETTVNGFETTEVFRTIHAPVGGAETVVVVSSEVRTDFPFGSYITQRIEGEGTAALTTSYEYWPVGSGVNEGRLKKVSYANGNWTYYHEYDARGRVLKQVEQTGNGSYTGSWPDEDNRMIEFLRTETVEEELVERLEWVEGKMVARSWNYQFTPEDDRVAPGQILPESLRIRSEATDVTVNNYLDPSNLITRTWYYSKDADGFGLPNEIKAVSNPDGTLVFYEYEETIGNGVIVRKIYGEPNLAGDAVAEGFIEETEENEHGEAVAWYRYYHQSGEGPLLLTFWVATAVDMFGRPTEIQYSDGTTLFRTYDCCGLESEIGRDGLETIYFYDSLQRVSRTEVYAGETLQSAEILSYDAAGRVVKRVRGGDANGTITEAEYGYLTNGDIAWKRDPLGRTITHAINRQHGSGYVQKTVSMPGLPAVNAVETYLYQDGSVYEEKGVAGLAIRMSYGVHADPFTAGNWLESRTQTYLADDGTPTNEFMTNLSHSAGAYAIQERPAADGSGTVQSVTETDLATRTRIRRDFTGRVELEQWDLFNRVHAVDVDGDETVSWSGSDAIRFSRDSYLDVHGTVVERTEQWEVTTPGGHWDDQLGVEVQSELVSKVDVELSDENSNGMERWLESYGAITYELSEWDEQNRTRTTTVTYPDGTGSIAVSVNGRLDETIRTDDSDASVNSVSYGYDEFGRQNIVDNSATGTIISVYDDLGRLVSYTGPDPDPGAAGFGLDPQTSTYSYTMDPSGFETITEFLASNEERYAKRDPQGRLVLQWGQGSVPRAWSYDHAGRPLTLTTWQEFNQATGTGVSGDSVTFWEYNAAGVLVRKLYDWREDLQNPGQYLSSSGPLHTWSAGGLLLEKTLPRNGSDGQPIIVRYDYDDGESGEGGSYRLLGIDYGTNTPETTDVIYTYDRLGRRVGVSDGSGTRQLTWTNGREASTEYTAGALAGYGVVRAYAAEEGGRLQTVSAHLPAGWAFQTIGYGYDGYGRIGSVTVDADEVTYLYREDTWENTHRIYTRGGQETVRQEQASDRLGRQVSFDAASQAGILFAWTMAYDDQNRVARKTEVSGGDYWDYGYDLLGQVTDVALKRSGGSIVPSYDFGYTFDAVGNRKTADQNGNVTGFSANALNQINDLDYPGLITLRGEVAASADLTVNGQSVPGANRENTSFYAEVEGSDEWVSLDIVGTLDGGGDGGNDAIAAEAGYTYIPEGEKSLIHDASGNLTQDARWNYRWNADNRLVGMETRSPLITAGAPDVEMTFAYDSEGRRVRKVVEIDGVVEDDLCYLWDGWLLLAEIDGANGMPERTYAWGADVGASLRASGGVGGLAFARDWERLETTVPLYGSNGNVRGYWSVDEETLVAEYDYGAFGEPLQVNIDGDRELPFGFSTKYTDSFSGLLYYGFRYYDPETGRWLSRDPLGEFSALNIYAFISNDPLNDFDLIGLTSYKGGSGANYRPDPFGHGSNADGSPRDPHIDRIEKGGQKSRYNPDGSPRKGAGNVPRKDQQAMGRAVSKLASILSRFVTLPVMLYVEPPEIEYPEPKDSVSPACSEVKPCEWKCKCPSGFINFGGQKIYKQKEAPSPDWLCDDAEFIL